MPPRCESKRLLSIRDIGAEKREVAVMLVIGWRELRRL